MLKIKGITVSNGRSFLIPYGVSRIINNGVEHEDSIFSAYDVYDENNNLITTIENCPVIIDYFTSDELKEKINNG